MTVMQYFMLVIFILTFVGLLKFQRVPERVFAGATLACLAGTFVNSDDILVNAVNPGLVTLIFLVLCSFSFERTSVLRRISGKMINGSRTKSTIKTGHFILKLSLRLDSPGMGFVNVGMHTT